MFLVSVFEAAFSYGTMIYRGKMSFCGYIGPGNDVYITKTLNKASISETAVLVDITSFRFSF